LNLLPLENGDAFERWAQQDTVPVTTIASGTAYSYSNFHLIGADGAEHPLGNLRSVGFCCAQGGTKYETTSGPWETLDPPRGRSLALTRRASAAVPLQVSYHKGGSIGPDGVRHDFPYRRCSLSTTDEDPPMEAELRLPHQLSRIPKGRQIPVPPGETNRPAIFCLER
jgi:hypothetical protein